MSLRWRFVVGLLAACGWICLGSVANASIGFQPISPEELKITNEPHAPGAPAIILYRQVDRDDNGRTSREDNYLRIKILTEAGRKYADVEIPFLKSTGNIVAIKARSIRPDGSVADFDGKVYEKQVVKAKGVKYLAKTFTLPDVQVGSIIEYSYSQDLSENYIYNSHWILSDELFTKSAKFSLKPFQGEGWSMRWTWHALPAGTAAPKEGPDHVFRLEAANIPAFPTEDYMPPENELKSRVDFIYSDEFVDQDVDKFWKKKAKKWNDQAERFVGKRKALEPVVAQIVDPNDPPEVKLQKIYARVQQIRNTSYERRKTEQEEKRIKEKEPENAEDLWKKGYGDGFDITWLYLALVRAAGFEAYPVWASDRSNYFFDPKVMDSFKLNSNMVLVKVNGKDLYSDPGAAFTPFGLLPWPETGVKGLKLDKDGGSWIVTSYPDSSMSRVERKADLALSETGDIEGKLTVTFRGLEALNRRLEERNEDDAQRKKDLEEEVKGYVPAACDVELTNQPEWNTSITPLVAEFSIKVPGWGAGAGRRVLFPIGIFTGTEKHVFDHADRVHPIYFHYSSQKLDDLSVKLPAGWQVSSVPKVQGQDQKVVVYASTVEPGKGTFHVTRDLRLDLSLVDVKYYSALREFFQDVRTGDEQQVVLQPAAASASN